MTPVQIVVAIFISTLFPTVTALIGILLNRRDAVELRSEMTLVRERLTALETGLGVKHG